jgi:hypothetical protein
VYTFLGIFMVLAIGGVILAQTNLHTRWEAAAADKHLPIFGGLYRGFGPRSQHATTAGTIINIFPNKLILQGDNGTMYTVAYNMNTRLPQPEAIAIGEHVIVGGDLEGNKITAFGIRPIQGDWRSGRGFRRGQ